MGEYVKGKIYYGIKTGLNEAFVIDETTKQVLLMDDARSAEIIKPFLAGRDVKRYQQPKSDKYLILFPKGFTNTKGNFPKNGWAWLKDNYKAIATYLEPSQEQGEKRSDKGDYWWELRACDYYTEFEKNKIIYPNICKQPEFVYDTKGWYTNQKCFIISLDDKYLLGILNSKLNYFLFEKYLPKLRGGFYEPSYIFFKHFPIKQPKTVDEKKLQNELVKLVDAMLLLKKEVSENSLSQKIESLQQRIIYTDEKINKLVYELYELTETEINIIEEL